MKKTRWMMLLLATVWTSLLLGSTVMAWSFKYRSEKEYRFFNVKPNTTVNLKLYMTLEDTYDDKTEENVYTTVYNQYKMVIPADGYIKVNIQGRHDHDGIDVFRKKRVYNSGKLAPHIFKVDYTDVRNGKNIIPISKGTYYFEASFSGIDTDTLPFSYSFTKTVFPANHSRAKAQTLKRGKKVEICQVPKKNYSRWFKIKLTKKQAITFWSDQGNHAAIFNEDLERLRIKRAGEKGIKYSTVQKLPKGTYYLRMSRAEFQYSYSENTDGYYYTTLYWK